MKTAMWMAAGALVTLFTASPALARDGATARERAARTGERVLVATSAATARTAPAHLGRACCVVKDGRVVDHLRG